MVQKLPGKVSKNSGNWWISEKRTIQPKIQENSGSKVEWKETFRDKFFSKIWVYNVLNFAYHLPKMWTDQFAPVNGPGKW